MGSYSVYVHTNKTNGKKYVGITIQKPTYRWKNGLGYKKSPVFWNAIQKYGWNGFDHEVLFSGLTKEQAEAKEKELIKKYKSNDTSYGYNMQSGGGITTLTELTKYKLKIINTGRNHTEETKRKMSLSHIGKQKCLGYKHSEETKEKHRKIFTRDVNPRVRAVNQYDLQGNFIKKFDCMEDIKKELNITSTCHISDCCRGIRNKCCGFIWRYGE